MKCNKCGQEFGSGIKCQYCGIDRVEGLAFNGINNAGTDGVKTNITEQHNNTCQQSACFKCGEIIPTTSTFCPFCGTQQIVECPKCKYKYPAKFPICSNCGTNREEFLTGYMDMPAKQATCITEVNEYGNTTEEKIDGLFCHQKKYYTGKTEDWYEYRGKRLPTELASYDCFYPLYGPIASSNYYLIFIPRHWSDGIFYGYIFDLEHYDTFQVPISYTCKGGGAGRNKRLNLYVISCSSASGILADYKGEDQLFSKGYLYYIYTYTYGKKGYRIINNIAAIHPNGIDFYECKMKKKSMMDSILYSIDVELTITLTRSLICSNNGRLLFQ